MHFGRLGGKFEAEGGCVGPGAKVDAPELSLGPVWEIEEVSRVGAQGVTSKSKLLAREMPRVCSTSKWSQFSVTKHHESDDSRLTMPLYRAYRLYRVEQSGRSYSYE